MSNKHREEDALLYNAIREMVEDVVDERLTVERLNNVVALRVEAVFRNKMAHYSFWKKIDDRIAGFLQKYKRVVDTSEAGPPRRAGDPWNHKEDALLSNAFGEFLGRCSVKHGRSYGAIKARIELKLL